VGVFTLVDSQSQLPAIRRPDEYHPAPTQWAAPPAGPFEESHMIRLARIAILSLVLTSACTHHNDEPVQSQPPPRPVAQQPSDPSPDMPPPLPHRWSEETVLFEKLFGDDDNCKGPDPAHPDMDRDLTSAVQFDLDLGAPFGPGFEWQRIDTITIYTDTHHLNFDDQAGRPGIDDRNGQDYIYIDGPALERTIHQARKSHTECGSRSPGESRKFEEAEAKMTVSDGHITVRILPSKDETFRVNFIHVHVRYRNPA
jgi:hypothetical protein